MTPDTLDAASELTQQRIEMAVAAHRLNHSAVSETHCEECGEELPEARRRLAGKRILDARCVWSVRAIWNCVRRLGGCDGLQQAE